jgi:prolipoprotein diacylglyceryltransferase
MANAYPVVFSLAALGNLLWLGTRNRLSSGESRSTKRNAPATTGFDAGLSTLITGLIGARLGFVFVHWDYYSRLPFEVFHFWQGGLSWVGGAVGAVLGLVLFSAYARRSFWILADALALPASTMTLACWTGCLFDGCAFGRQIDAKLWALPAPDMFGSWVPRWPTQALGVLFSLIAIVALYLLTNRLRSGVLACLCLTFIAAGVLSLSFTRGDPVMLMAGIRLDSLGSAAILLIAIPGTILRSTLGRAVRKSDDKTRKSTGNQH